MHTSLPKITCGDVVAYGPSIFVIQEVLESDMTVVRVEARGGIHHRADVVPEHWSDLALSGLPLQDVVIRCVPIRFNKAAKLVRLGTLPDKLQRRIDNTLRVERMARRFEDSPTVQSNLLASTSSCGRRVGAVRYA